MTLTVPFARRRIHRCLAVLVLLSWAVPALQAQEPAAAVAGTQPAPAPSQPAGDQPTPAQTLGISIEPSSAPVTLTYFNRPILELRAAILGRTPDERRAIAVQGDGRSRRPPGDRSGRRDTGRGRHS